MKINIEGEKIIGIFKGRLNRFVAEVIIDNNIEVAHVPNTGRMKELLLPGAKVILRRRQELHRKTSYDLLMVYKGNILVSIDSRLPNSLLEKAFINKNIPYFKDFYQIKREVNFEKSKLDFYLANDNKSAFIEVKSVTLVKENQVASFPDAPTERGRKHVCKLIQAQKHGFRTAVFFIVQRKDAIKFTPNKEMDIDFAETVKTAKKQGVEFYAYNCLVTPESIELKEEIEVII